MTVTSTAGYFGLGLQAAGAKGGAVSAWSKYAATLIDMAPADDVRVGPVEIGGQPVPSLAFKAGIMNAGGMTTYPRLENSFGNILLATFGACTTVANKDIDGATVTGLNAHTFKFASQPSFVPYVSIRRKIPADLAANELGEEFADSKILGLTLNFASDDLLSARLDFMGRTNTMVENPDATWTFANGIEEYDSVPVGATVGGALHINDGAGYDVDLPIVGAVANFVNSPLDPRQERQYGSPYISDVTIVSRALTFDIVCLWQNPDLYQRILTGQAAGTTWSSKPFTASIKILALTPTNIGGAIAHPYKLRLTSNLAVMQLARPIALATQQSVIMAFRGTALKNASDYAKIEIQNEIASYALPA